MAINTKLSIIVLAGNESEVIVDCLKSCIFADEIILVAANSTDETVVLARKTIPKIKIFKTSDEYNKNFSKWRNLGYQKSTGEWIFYVDSDERVTPELQKEILSTIQVKNTKYSYYVMPRLNYFLGKRVKYGGAYPDYVKRLFFRSDFKGFQGILHEEPNITGNFDYLKSPLLHYTHRHLKTMLEKSLVWTNMEAEELYKNHHPPVVWWRIIRMMLTKIWQRLIKGSMWRDGTVGWISVIFETFDTFIIYARLWEIQQSQK
jgi:glycosyltransferase involved in cell wall biosynthesis